MKCYNCGEKYTEHTGSLELPSKILSSFTVTNVTYYKCQKCNEIILTDSAWDIADKEENRIISQIVSSLPFNKFINASKAAEILGMTRQAIHKHRRIRRGFIYSSSHDGKIYYHIDSVNLFKNTKDGRFPLKGKIEKREKKYVVITLKPTHKQTHSYEYGGIEPSVEWEKSNNIFQGHLYEKEN